MSERFLRLSALRNLLYEWADGRCVKCGVPLPADWHADHTVPWAVSRSTNVLEMQALCPACNRKKGDKVPGNRGLSSANIDIGAMRPGQRTAVTTLWDNVRNGKQHTGILLPTRYRKSDVIKMGGLGLLLDDLVSRVVVMAPAQLLVTQVLDRAKMMETGKRYAIPPLLNEYLSVWHTFTPPRKPFPRGNACFVAFTIQWATINCEFLVEWVKAEYQRSRRKPIFFIDEVHGASTDNRWGDTAEALGRAGAWLCLCTATPYRTDKMPIAGFDYKEVDRGWKEVRRNNTIWAGEEVKYQLLPDHETTFAEAWAEVPPALCHLNRIPISPTSDRLDTATLAVKGTNIPLSQTPLAQQRSLLQQLVRADHVIENGCDKLINEMRAKRGIAPDTAAIVFVGNDTDVAADDEREQDLQVANRHAEQVKAILKSKWKAVEEKNLDVRVATSKSENDPKVTIKQFQEGYGDVLIVKQMGGVGMDVPRSLSEDSFLETKTATQ